MKKALLILFGILIIGIILVMSFGIQIGNVRIGKQNDTLGVKQNLELENSDFNGNIENNDNNDNWEADLEANFEAKVEDQKKPLSGNIRNLINR